MRKAAMAMISVIVASLSFTAHAAPCQATTASGGCKDTTGTIHCGTKGKLPTGLPINVYQNTTASGGELEVCSDSGSGNQRGRVIVQGDTTHGARVILDTDAGQPFPPGWITVQASSDHPGLWCNKKGPADPAHSDGYARPWNSPGTDGGADQNAVHCVPTLPAPLPNP